MIYKLFVWFYFIRIIKLTLTALIILTLLWKDNSIIDLFENGPAIIFENNNIVTGKHMIYSATQKVKCAFSYNNLLLKFIFTK